MADGIRGDVVRRLRLERGWTQADLARETGIAQSTLSRIESGKSIGSYATTVRALARVYGCGEGDLVGDDAGELHTVPDDASPALAGKPETDGIVAEVIAGGRVRPEYVRRGGARPGVGRRVETPRGRIKHASDPNSDIGTCIVYPSMHNGIPDGAITVPRR